MHTILKEKIIRNDPLLPVCEPSDGEFELLECYEKGTYREIQITHEYSSDNDYDLGGSIIEINEESPNGTFRGRTEWNYKNLVFENGNYYSIDTKNGDVKCDKYTLEKDGNNKFIKPRYHIIFNDGESQNTIKIYTFKGNLFVREWYTDKFGNETYVDFKLDVYDYIELNQYATEIEMNGCMFLGHDNDKDGYKDSAPNDWYQNWNLIIKVWNKRFQPLRKESIKNELNITENVYYGKWLSEEDNNGFTLLYQTIIENDVFIDRYAKPDKRNKNLSMKIDIDEYPIKLNHLLIKGEKKFKVMGKETGTIQIRGNFIMKEKSEIITGTLYF